MGRLGTRLVVPNDARTVTDTGYHGIALAAASGQEVLRDWAEQIADAGGERPEVQQVTTSTEEAVWVLKSTIASGTCVAQTDASDRFVLLRTSSD